MRLALAALVIALSTLMFAAAPRADGDPAPIVLWSRVILAEMQCVVPSLTEEQAAALMEIVVQDVHIDGHTYRWIFVPVDDPADR
jgi:hypothetical protein